MQQLRVKLHHVDRTRLISVCGVDFSVPHVRTTNSYGTRQLTRLTHAARASATTVCVKLLVRGGHAVRLPDLDLAILDEYDCSRSGIMATAISVQGKRSSARCIAPQIS